MSLNIARYVPHVPKCVLPSSLPSIRAAGTLRVHRNYSSERSIFKVTLPTDLHRSSQTPDRKEFAPSSSYGYLGVATNLEDNGHEKRMTIDNSLTVWTVSDKIRQPAVEALKKIRNRNLMVGGLCLSGVAAGCALPHLEQHPNALYVGAALALASGPLSAVFFSRSSSVSKALSEWKDPVYEILESRRVGLLDFCEVQKSGLKGKVFSEKEIMHIWFRTFQRQYDQFHNVLWNSDDPKKMATYIEKLVQKCPLTKTAMDHAFDNRYEVFNPEHPELLWRRDDIHQVSNIFNEIKVDFASLKNKFAHERKKVAQRDKLLHKAEETTLQAGLAFIESEREQALLPYKKERDHKLADLKKAYEGKFVIREDWELQSAKINRKYAENPDVVRINSFYDNSARLAKGTGTLAIKAVEASTEISNSLVDDKEIDQVNKQFRSRIRQLFDSFYSHRKSSKEGFKS